MPTTCATSSHKAIHKYFKEDNELKSHASSRIHSTGGSLHRKNTLTAPSNPLRKSQGDEDIPKIIMSMTVGKGTGMSDAEWNDIVRKKVAAEHQEDAHAKDKLQK